MDMKQCEIRNLATSIRPPDKSAYKKIIFSYFSTKTYGVGTQKNRSKHMFKLMGKKIIAILRYSFLFFFFFLLKWPYALF